MPLVKNITIFFDQMETNAVLTLSACRSSLQPFIGLSLGRFPFTQWLRSDRNKGRSSSLALLGVTYLGKLPLLVAEVRSVWIC